MSRKNNLLRICFMGTPSFAVTSLDAIFHSKHEIVGVVTAPDKPAGRGRRLQTSEVKKYALEKELALYQPTNLKSEEFSNELKEMNPDLIVVVAFRMLPKQVWNFPKLGTFNVHASLLPDYRGAAPIHWAIINGEQKTGVTTFFLNEDIDTGEIILQKELSIGKNDSLSEIYPKLEKLGAEALVETLDLIASGNAKSTPQPNGQEVKHAPKLTKENTQLDWNANTEEIHNMIRGLSPFPVSWTTLKSKSENYDEKLCKIYKASIYSNEIIVNPGEIISDKKKILVQTKDGILSIEEMKIEGKKKMSAIDLINGNLIDGKSYFS